VHQRPDPSVLSTLRLEKAAEKAGIERTRLHNLRHSAISLLLNSGADPFAVQKLAGHSDGRYSQVIG
jgi:site-specific recombinase XerD